MVICVILNRVYNVVFKVLLLYLLWAWVGLQFEGVSVPVEVKEQLLLKFSERQEGMGKHGKTLHTLSQRMKDKIRLHLFVLTLMVDDFMVDCRPLQLDLKLTTTK